MYVRITERSLKVKVGKQVIQSDRLPFSYPIRDVTVTSKAIQASQSEGSASYYEAFSAKTE